MKSFGVWAKVVVFTLVLLFTAFSVVGAAPNGVNVNKELAKVRQATAKYHDVQNALDDGYVNTGHFVYIPELGGMGIHFVNENLIDDDVDPLQPEALMYVQLNNGKYKLIGVEYMSSSEQELFGQVFDPPVPPGPPEYTLHAWIWQPNPSGMFAPFNPTIKPDKH